MTEFQLILFSAAGSAAGGAAGAWLALRDRVMNIEHELWGVKGTNGLKSEMRRLNDTFDEFVLIERHSVMRMDARNKQQHPEENE